ncbi:CDP-alcohol phosphatidyltransferase [Clostridium zeae]|uniref:CDP-alcohol phosphatidyltransferase n=1 Tax=Clostridium zeae TaxID=2759022 RepID=A0ABQ1EF78_9CLOT|nr:CDP-alcohol phosphatidyltransferase family protein [Clostridium zeae]GFZ33416.1 CDP-alcohol phosphatidyltransferase [Clostridium zeae]
MDRVLKIIPNGMTIARIIMTIVFDFLIFKQFLYGQDYNAVLISLFIMICVSDFFDGKIARRLEVATAIGAKLDVLADLLYIVSSYAALISTHVLPLWYLVFVCIKFLEFVATSNFIKLYQTSSEHPFIFDRIGRTVSAIFFLIPGIICISNLFNTGSTIHIVSILLYSTFLGGVYSSYERIKSCYIMASLKYDKVRK